MDTDFWDLEKDLLGRMLNRDWAGVASCLTDEFVITTAGWMPEPVNRQAWLEQLAQSAVLATAELRSVNTRAYAGCVITLVLSSQTGTHQGETFDMDFRYTDVWVPGPDRRWLLDLRHAGIAARR